MSPDFVALPESATVGDALAAVRNSKAPPEALNVVFATAPDGGIVGSASIVRLVQAPAEATLATIVVRNPAHVHPDWDLGGTVRKMSDFNLTVAPVMDPEHREILGVVTVDDVLELLLPTGWRRDFGVTAVEE